MPDQPEDRKNAADPGAGCGKRVPQKTGIFTDSSALKIFDDVLRKSQDRNDEPDRKLSPDLTDRAASATAPGQPAVESRKHLPSSRTIR